MGGRRGPSRRRDLASGMIRTGSASKLFGPALALAYDGACARSSRTHAQRAYRESLSLRGHPPPCSPGGASVDGLQSDRDFDCAVVFSLQNGFVVIRISVCSVSVWIIGALVRRLWTMT